MGESCGAAQTGAYKTSARLPPLERKSALRQRRLGAATAAEGTMQARTMGALFSSHQVAVAVESSNSKWSNRGTNAESPIISCASSMSLSVSCTDNVSTDSMIKKMQEAREYEVDQLPEYKHDPNYLGKEYDTDLRCLCQRRPARRVASSGVNTGRRFLGCPKKWVKCHFVKWVDPEWDELAAKTIFSLSERNIVLQKSLNDVNKSWMSLYARKMREDDLWSRKLANARIDLVDDLDKIKSIGDDLVKIKLIGLVVMVTLFVSVVAKLGW